MRIPRLDQRNLRRPRPSLQLFLPSEGLVHVVIRRPVQKALHIVLTGETLHLVELVVENPLVQIARETNVEGSRQATHDVYAIASPLSGSHEGIGMLRLRSIVLRTILLRSA